MDGRQSRAQRFVNEVLEKQGINPTMLNLVKKFRPDIAGALDMANDPYELHNTLSIMYKALGEILKEDHNEGYGGEGECPCFATDTPETSGLEGLLESSESVLRGDDGQREEYTYGSSDEELPELVFDPKEPSQNPHSGYEAQVQSGSGTEWTSDEPDW